VYFSSHGVLSHPSYESSGRPIGALALAAAAVSQSHPSSRTHLNFSQVERGYVAHRTGDYIASSKEFSTTNWINQTDMYLEKINALTDEEWKGIYIALDQLQETCAREDKIHAGAVPEEYEPLLPDDPPSSPPA
jgi:hypothetical protein